MNNLGLAIAMGIIYWISNNAVGYTLWAVLGRPLFLALPIGLLYGDVPTAMMVGASIQAMYIVLIAPGMQIPADPALATCIALPLVLKAGISPEVAVTIAVPFGVLGVFLDQIRRTANGMFNRMADRYAEESNIRGIILAASAYPLLLSFPIRFIPVFLANYFGEAAVQGLLNSIPEWLMHAFEVAGGVLPAIGFAIAIMVIGKKKLLPFFILGFFLVQYSSISVMGAAIFGICIAIIYLQCTSHEYNQESTGREV